MASKMIIHAPLTGLTYTFDGDHRTGSTTTASDYLADAEDIYECSSDSKLIFNAGAKIQIKKARLVSSGAIGLSTSAGEIAAKLLLIQGADAGGGAITRTANTSETLLKFANWNEWEDKNVSIEIAADGSKLGTGTGSVIHVDDFNIQDPFSGQQVQAVLEAEIEFSP